MMHDNTPVFIVDLLKSVIVPQSTRGQRWGEHAQASGLLPNYHVRAFKVMPKFGTYQTQVPCTLPKHKVKHGREAAFWRMLCLGLLSIARTLFTRSSRSKVSSCMVVHIINARLKFKAKNNCLSSCTRDIVIGCGVGEIAVANFLC